MSSPPMSRSDFRFFVWYALLLLVLLALVGPTIGWSAIGIALLSIAVVVLGSFLVAFIVIGVNKLIDKAYEKYRSTR